MQFSFLLPDYNQIFEKAYRLPFLSLKEYQCCDLWKCLSFFGQTFLEDEDFEVASDLWTEEVMSCILSP